MTLYRQVYGLRSEQIRLLDGRQPSYYRRNIILTIQGTGATDGTEIAGSQMFFIVKGRKPLDEMMDEYSCRFNTSFTIAFTPTIDATSDEIQCTYNGALVGRHQTPDEASSRVTMS